MTKKTLVVANGQPPSLQLLKSLITQHSQLVAVDGGLSSCLQYGLEPHLIIGDFDSIAIEMKKKLPHTQYIYTPDQNKSDLAKTLEYLFDAGADEITVCGAAGRRLDHTLTNIYLLARYPNKVKFETDIETCFAVPKSSVLQCRIGQVLSLIPMSTEVSQVVTCGLKWELKGEDLSKTFVGISNVCLQPSVSISFVSGDLVICMVREE